MKVLHIATLNSSRKNIGVARQMQYEKSASRRLGLEWDVQLWAGDKVQGLDVIYCYPRACYSRILKRMHFFRVLRKASYSYDVILLRYPAVDPFLPFFISKRAKVVFVHHTKEVHAIKSNFTGWKRSLLSVAEYFLGFFSLLRADAIVGATREIVHYERRRSLRRSLPYAVYPNGIDLLKFSKVSDRRFGRTKLLFTATTFFPWHGLSQLLESLVLYGGKNNVELHLVGRVLDKDQAYISEMGLEKVVVQHGQLAIGEIRERLAETDVGIASFDLGQSSMLEACTLKVREYLAAGVPVYSGHIDSGLPENYKYYQIGPPDFVEIIKYALTMRQYSREEVRESASLYIDKESLVDDLYSWVVKI